MKKKNSLQSRIRPERTGNRATVILGIDPGTLVTGYGILSSDKGGTRLLTAGAIRNRRDHALPDRLRRIHEELCSMIARFRPDGCAIESAFYGKNAQSALKLGHARGVSILAAASAGIPVCEYSPREIKKALTGNGNAAKTQVQYMVQSMLHIGKTHMALDTSDAIATAMCHLQRLNGHSHAPRDWKSFALAHPERVVR